MHSGAMSQPLSATAFLNAITVPKAKVFQVANWRTHNRNHKGLWGPVNGIVVHHTVSKGTEFSVDLCHDGYTDLPGPLCHVVSDKEGGLHLVGYGRTNHAGLGDATVLSQVIAENYGLTPSRPKKNDTDGNARFYGFEMINMGDNNDPWPVAQLDAVANACAGICKAHRWTAKSVIGHKEWQVGKPDPTFDMIGFRKRVASFM